MEEQVTTRKLNTLSVGEKGIVVGLLGGRQCQHRLVSMGINVGCEIEILHSSHGQGGPTLVKAGETRLAVGRGMADKVLVAADTQENPPETYSFGRFRHGGRFRRGWFGRFI